MRFLTALICLFALSAHAQVQSVIPNGTVMGNTSGATGAPSSTNPSTLPITATGSTTARTLAARALDMVNVKDYGAVGNGTTDDTVAIKAALTTCAKTVVIPATASGYLVSGILVPCSNQTISGLNGQPVILLVSATISRIFDLTGLTNVTLTNLSLNGSGAAAGGDFIRFYNTTNSVLQNFVLTSPPGSSGAGAVILAQTSTGNKIHDGYISNSSGSAAITVNASTGYDNTIGPNITFATTAGFGVRILGGASKNRIIGNSFSNTGIESIAVSLGSARNIVANNHIDVTGDNCISIVGDHNTITGNVGYKCAKSGLYLWGSFNTATGNSFLDNNQIGGGQTWPCIGANANYGATAQGNSVSGNTCDDDQATPTQYGITFGTPSYTAWTTGTSYTSGQYIYNGLNVYSAGSAGTAGATPPTCTSGTCSDGTITWTYDSTFITQPFNIFQQSANTVLRYAGTPNASGLPVQTFALNRNPDFFISQPYGSTSQTSIPFGTTIVDGWTLSVTSTRGSYQRFAQASSAQYPNYWGFTSSGAYTPAASDLFQITTRVETSDITALQWGTSSARPIELDIGVQTISVFGCIGIEVDNGNVTRGYVTSVCTTQAGTWQYFSMIIPGDIVPAAQGLRVQIAFGAGSNYQTSVVNSWQPVTSTTYAGPTNMLQVVSTSGAALLVNYVHVLPFGSTYIRRSYVDELRIAERYYFKTFTDATNPGTGLGLAGSLCTQNPVAAGRPSAYLRLPTDFSPVNTAPTITTYNPTNSNANWYDVTAAADVAVSVDPATAVGKSGLLIGTGASVANAGDVLCIQATVDSKR